MANLRLFIILSVLLFTSCQPQTTRVPSPAPTFTQQASPTIWPTPTLTVAPTATAEPTRAPAPTLPPTPRVCSPLQGQALDQLSQLIANPYHPPAPGSDDPHQGVDLAIKQPGTQMAVAGNPVQAALAGRVAGVVSDRFPYGNALIIETPLENFTADWWAAAEIPTPAPTLEPRSALTCPPGPEVIIPDANKRSLYVLYGHMQSPTGLAVGDSVSCGQEVGAVGSTGNALNPHLHFEARVAPSGLTIDSLAHYDASATPAEMRSYCLWRVSGLFQLVDPDKVLLLAP